MYSEAYHTTANAPSGYDSEALLGNDPKQYESGGQERILQKSRRGWMIFALVEAVIILVSQWAAYNYTSPCIAQHALVKDAIRYETRVFHTGYSSDRTPYIAKPSLAVDALWEDLYRGGIFKITKDEERMLSNKTSAVPGNRDHFASSLAVVHHLHCLNNMRKSLWPEYYPEFDVHRSKKAFSHQEHCIEVLRQVHMCHPDTTPEVFQWDADQQKMIIPADRQHTCVDFKAIQQWMRERMLHDDEFGDHSYIDGDPVYNPAYVMPAV